MVEETRFDSVAVMVRDPTMLFFAMGGGKKRGDVRGNWW
jgi:hypothetical protein